MCIAQDRNATANESLLTWLELKENGDVQQAIKAKNGQGIIDTTVLISKSGASADDTHTLENEDVESNEDYPTPHVKDPLSSICNIANVFVLVEYLEENNALGEQNCLLFGENGSQESTARKSRSQIF